MYFSMLPKIYLNVNNEYFQYASDITARIKIDKKIKELYTAFEYYDIENDDTPELVAAKLYDDPNYNWVILIINEVIDPRYDWVLPQSVFQKYVENKYGAENIAGVHHYEKKISNDLFLTYATATEGAELVTNYEYEERLNEKKRQIIIVKPEYLILLVNEFSKLLNE